MGARFDVCVLGSLNSDLVVRAPRLPGAGETLLGGPFERHPGGKGANQAVAAARMGALTALIGAVGDDENGRELVRVLRAERVDVSHVAVRDGAATGVALITVADSGENSIVVAPGANATLAPEDVERARELVAASGCLVAQLEVPLETVAHAFALAKASRVRTILNAAPARELPAALLASTDVLIVNEAELQVVSGLRVADLGRARARRAIDTASTDRPGELEALALACSADLHELGPELVLVTLGARGAIASRRDGGFGRAAFAVDVVDTTGAGDAFVGACAHGLARNDGVERALERACAAGALACTVRGAIPSMPAAVEVERLLVSRRT